MLILLPGCRSKKIAKESETIKEVQKTEIKKDSISTTEKIQEKKVESKKDQSEKVKERETDITIKGKAETGKPIELHEISGNDTLQTIRITGNADVVIHSKNKNSSSSKSNDQSESISDKLKNFSQNIVDDNNLSERFSDIKKKAKDVKIADTSTGVYITAIVLGAITIIALFIFIYFKKKKS